MERGYSKTGYFVVSLDFELFWGVRDAKSIDEYKQNLLGVQEVIPSLLSMFDQYDIHATFATVGFLFSENKQELMGSIPTRIPNYINQRFSPYVSHINSIGENEKEDPIHYGASLIDKIITQNQEIGCHTFSHYYCLEDGQTIDDFEADVDSAISIASKKKIKLNSLVFPRNQINKDYLNLCKQKGFICYRGNEPSWLYKPRKNEGMRMYIRILKVIDSYINITGYNSYTFESCKNDIIYNIPSSRFLRPYSKKISILESLKISRILSEMTHAAKNNLVYHLWWHPHNFGTNISKNLNQLEIILKHYQMLSKRYGFQSHSMSDIANKLNTVS